MKLSEMYRPGAKLAAAAARIPGVDPQAELHVVSHPDCPGPGAAQPGNGGASLLPSATPRKRKHRRYMRTEGPRPGTDQGPASGPTT